MSRFVHLHAHTHYSLLDGLGKIPDIVDRAKALGMDSLAITDHGVLYGAVEFYQAATKAGIKPIIGVEAYVAPGSRHAKATAEDGNPYHLILLAKNRTGYQNLLKLVTEAHLSGFYYKPRIDWELLQEHKEGIICTSACLQGEVAQAVRRGDESEAKRVVERYAELFGPDHYYLELQDHPSIREQGIHNGAVKRLAKETGLPLVATNDSHYVLPEDAEAQDVLLCVQTGKLVEDSDRMNMTGEDFSLQSPEQMSKAFAETPEAVTNTVKIADACDLELEFGKIILPKYPVEKGGSEYALLQEKVAAGIKGQYGDSPSKEITERVKYEMDVIKKVKFEPLFLIVADMVGEAKSRGIAVGPGRGSAAGSIVSYALGITTLDPIEYGLMFERFLNPERISMPDFDLDFADDRRGEVIEYLAEKYGSDRVAQIITFGTMAARAATRDTGRVLGLPYGTVDQVAKLIPFGMGLAEAKKLADVKALADDDPQVKRLLDLAERLEGVCRHASTHAAGVVIGEKPLVNYAPLQYGTKGDTAVVTQYSMVPIEDIGLLKIDVLGLANLTILRNALEIIEAVDGVEIDLEGLPLDDAQTFELLARGQTHGIFQLESDGMRRYIKELKPNKLADIIAMVSLYRPGPMQWIDSFIKRKHGKEQVSYVHPKVEDALKETYGVIVYQEQVMQISRDLCGFTGGEADTLRKAVGKKIAKLLAEQKEKFVAGAVKHGGMAQGAAEKLFADLEDFARYAFNKAHAACYAMIAYQTAYLKAHYPKPFMAALMTSEQENLDKLTAAITECEQMGIRVLPPDINESFASFAVTPDKQSIRFGLNAIKNVGHNTVEAIVKQRKAKGPFRDINDFLRRLPDGTANKKSLEGLIKAGALDSLADRGQLLAGLEGMARFASARAAETRAGQSSLFGEESGSHASFSLPPAGEVDQRQKLEWERELLGMYVSEHPLQSYQHLLAGVTSLSEVSTQTEGRQVTTCGLVAIVKRITTRKGDPMAFVTIEDTHRQLEMLVFPNLYNEAKDMLIPGAILKVRGKLSRKDDEPKILADKLRPLTDEPGDAPRPDTVEDISVDDAESGPLETVADAVAQRKSGESAPAAESPDTLTVTLSPETTLASLESIKDVLNEHRGESPVCLVISRNGEAKRLRLSQGVRHSKGLVEALQSVDQGVAVSAG